MSGVVLGGEGAVETTPRRRPCRRRARTLVARIDARQVRGQNDEAMLGERRSEASQSCAYKGCRKIWRASALNECGGGGASVGRETRWEREGDEEEGETVCEK